MQLGLTVTSTKSVLCIFKHESLKKLSLLFTSFMGLHFLSSDDVVVVGVISVVGVIVVGGVVVVVAVLHPAWKAPGHLPSSWFYK